jgi:hypothetical protein
VNFSSDPNEWLNYCGCGEYLGPVSCNATCTGKYGCGSRHRGFYCEKDVYGNAVHTWIADWSHSPPTRCESCGMVELREYMKTLDWNSRDPNYWREIFHHVRERAYSNDIHDFVAEIKRHRYQHRLPQPKQNDYGRRINAKLEGLLNDASSGLDCVDNYRYALKSSRRDMRRFRREAGCCGRHVETVTVEGREYVIGFNYGH